MAINLDAIKSRLNKLQNTQRTTVELWKPAPGKHTIRLVPYKFNKENPFIELYFHYNINNKTFVLGYFYCGVSYFFIVDF